MMRVVIIDDEARTRKSIAELLKYSSHEVELVAEAEDVSSGINVLNNFQPELVLLDINMPDGTGFDLLKQISNINFKIIFITAYQEYAIQAFEFSAIDYILKPVDPQKLMAAIDKAHQMVEKENFNIKLNALFSNMEQQNSDHKKLVLKTAENIYLVSTKDISRCESDGGYTKFFCKDGRTILVSKNLKEYEDLLSQFGFFRIHQSHLINLKFVDHYRKVDGGEVVMTDQSELPLSRRKKENFLKLLEMI